MFKDLEKLSKIGTVIFGNGNNTSNNFFCFWQSSNSFDFTNGLLTDLELSEYNFIASALEDCKCIPFARGNTPVEAYEKMINIFDKYFDEDGNWISFDYYYGNFITSAAEIKGYIDFSCNKEENFDFFNTLKRYPESYEKIANLVVNKYAETKNIENVKNYFIDELDQFITTSMIEKILEYVVNNKS